MLLFGAVVIACVTATTWGIAIGNLADRLPDEAAASADYMSTAMDIYMSLPDVNTIVPSEIIM